ncbi:hypothetical protein CQY20_04070 [Mycolicibacterium agri]|nr:hypothetical protein CQY20_04070 [Mycolicibacterium agri]
MHKVVSGETLWAIAEKYYGEGNLFTLIAAANKLPNANLIRPGDVLIIPPKPTSPGPPDTYTVAPGDKLWDIAKRFYGDGNKYSIIANANHIADPDLILPGQQLIIPRLNRPGSQAHLVAVTDDAHIVVRFGSQHVFEQAWPDPPGTATGTAQSRAANESRVVFAVPKGTTMAFTVPGVLAGLTQLRLRVSPLAVPRAEDTRRPPDAQGPPTPPKGDQTAIEAPYRLVVSPDERYGGFAHSADAAEAPGDPSRVELWHTRLAVRMFDSQDRFVGIDERDNTRRTVRAIWSRDENGSGAPATGFEGSLNPADRRAIVRQTADPRLEDRNQSGKLIEPNPLTVDRFYLSSLGAWIDWRAAWEWQRYKPPGAGEKILSAYRHLATLGRDHYVRVEIPIYLYPFGQFGTLVKLTERRINLGEDEAAYLFTRKFIVLRQPLREYSEDLLQVGNVKASALYQLPFTATLVDPIVSPNLDSADESKPFVPHVGGKPYRWKVTGIDHAKRRVSMMTALVVVPAGLGPEVYGKAQKTWFDDVMNNTADKHPIDLNGAEVAFAPSDNAGDTTMRVQGMEFHGEAYDHGCTPWLFKAQVAIPALATLNKVGGPVAVKWAGKYRSGGFNSADKAEIFLTLDNEAKLDFAGGSDRGGGFVEPTISVKGISRVLGGVGDTTGSPTGIAGGHFDPDLFKGTALPKLFGLINLFDIIAKDGGFERAPRLIAEQFGLVKTIDTAWRRLIDALTQAREIFDSDRKIPDAPAGAKLRADALYNSANSAINNLAQAPLQQLLAGLSATPPSNAHATEVANRLTNMSALLTDPFLPAFLRAQLQRPYDATNAALTTARGTDFAKALRAAVENNVVRYEWSPTIKGWPDADHIFHPNDVKRGLNIAVEVRTAKDGRPQSDVSAQLRDFELRLLPGQTELLRIKFGRIGFRMATGGKPEVDVQFNGMEFLGVLGFIEKLRQIIPFDGFSDPPYVDVDTGSVTAGFDLALPSVAIGVFSLENIALGADCRVPFLGEAVTVGFYFCTKEAPFRLTVMAIGGGGWVGIRLSPDGLVLLEMGLEAGASLSVDLGVASGSVSVMVGVYLRLEDKIGQLTGYFRIRGEVEVLGIASASITLELSLTYHFQSGKLIGRASLQVEIEVAFFSASVEITCERKLAGSRGDPTLRDIMPPEDGGQTMWNKYFDSFAIAGD